MLEKLWKTLEGPAPPGGTQSSARRQLNLNNLRGWKGSRRIGVWGN